MSADGAGSGAFAPDVAAEEEEIDNLFDGGDGIFVLGETHGPAADDALGANGDGGGLLDLLAGEAAGFGDVVPVGGAEVFEEGVEAVGVSGDELAVENGRAGVLGGEHFLADATEGGEVAVDADGEPEVGEGDGAIEEHRAGKFENVRVFLGVGIDDPHEAGLGHGVEGDDGRAALLGVLERGQHAGVIRPGVLADDEDAVGFLEIIEGDAAFADADGFVERRAGGLVAHVRAIGQVVGAEEADEELIQEGGFVAGAAAGVEGGGIGGGEGFQLGGEEGEGVVPRDGLVVGGVGAADHGVGEAALLLHPVIAAGGEVGDGVFGEKVGRDELAGGFAGKGLGSVFAEFEGVAVVVGIGAWPGAALAIEAVLLVDLGPGREALAESTFAGHEFEALPDGGHPGGGLVGVALVGGGGFFGRLGSGDAHTRGILARSREGAK